VPRKFLSPKATTARAPSAVEKPPPRSKEYDFLSFTSTSTSFTRAIRPASTGRTFTRSKTPTRSRLLRVPMRSASVSTSPLATRTSSSITPRRVFSTPRTITAPASTRSPSSTRKRSSTSQ